MKNIVEELLLENLNKKNVRFVFPTQIACELWQDWIVVNSPVKAIATDRFIAWDEFKGNSIRSKKENKTSIPSVMRKIFVARLISQNEKEKYFNNLIVPKYARTAEGFASWIQGILPGLSMWKKYFEASGKKEDEEDKDLLTLYNLYSGFLDKYEFFDPAWETPPFVSDGNKYIVIFPEILSDYFEYKNLLEESKDDILIVHVPELKKDDFPECNFYSNFRLELKSVSLAVREAHEVNDIPWQKIAVSVPDIENYRDYIKREFTLYEIPFVIKEAENLSETRAGNLFNLINDCYINDFSYESLRSLLLNSEFPWKDKNLINELIEFGRLNNCICSFDYNEKHFDVWKESFKNPLLKKGEKFNELIVNYFESLKESVNAMVGSKTFDEIRKNYFEFKNKFFDVRLFGDSTNKILSRCITELASLIDLEKKYSDCNVDSCFSFFINHLSQTKYLSQTSENGVQVLPYKTLSCAPFDFHVIIDSSQSAVSVVYKNLSFLREDKRKLLLGKNYEDPVVTNEFISLYIMNSLNKPALFTCSEKTLTGYSQTLSDLKENNLTKKNAGELFAEKDLYKNERDFFNETKNFPSVITAIEKNGFNNWVNKSLIYKSGSLQNKISQNIKNKMSAEGKLVLSSTQLDLYLSCPRSWYFYNISEIRKTNDEADLVDVFSMGNLKHKILENYCNLLKENNLMLYAENGLLPENYEDLFSKSVDSALEELVASSLSKQLLLTTKNSLYDFMKPRVEMFSSVFNGCQIYAMEKEYTLDLEEPQCILKGRIDCILYDPSEDEFFVVDFKSSSGGVPKLLYAEDDETSYPKTQMQTYVTLLENQHEKIKIENCCYFIFSDNKCAYVFGEKLFDRIASVKSVKKDSVYTREKYEYTMQVYRECLNECVLKLNEGDISVSKEKQNFSVCSGCNYREVCRRTFVVGKK